MSPILYNVIKYFMSVLVNLDTLENYYKITCLRKDYRKTETILTIPKHCSVDYISILNLLMTTKFYFNLHVISPTRGKFESDPLPLTTKLFTQKKSIGLIYWKFQRPFWKALYSQIFLWKVFIFNAFLLPNFKLSKRKCIF